MCGARGRFGGINQTGPAMHFQGSGGAYVAGGKKSDDQSASKPAARRRLVALPEPRFLDQATAAAYFGISERTFEALWRSYRMPRPHRFGRRLVWDRKHLDEFADRISKDELR